MAAAAERNRYENNSGSNCLFLSFGRNVRAARSLVCVQNCSRLRFSNFYGFYRFLLNDIFHYRRGSEIIFFSLKLH